jgi:alpha-glucosidase
VEDAAMNYRGFTFPVWAFLANTDISMDPQRIDAQTCMAWMDNYRAGLSHQQQLRMFNQLDSHDTPRFKTVLGKDVVRLPLAVIWLFTWPGVPCIYYGDEVGLDGANDPFCRKPFPWDKAKQDTELLALYQRMSRLRKRSRALCYGGCHVIYAEENVVIFLRLYQQERVLVAVNRGEPCEVVLPASPLLDVKVWHSKEGRAHYRTGCYRYRQSLHQYGRGTNFTFIKTGVSNYVRVLIDYILFVVYGFSY